MSYILFIKSQRLWTKTRKTPYIAATNHKLIYMGGLDAPAKMGDKGSAIYFSPELLQNGTYQQGSGGPRRHTFLTLKNLHS
jgi:hypothetical protein